MTTTIEDASDVDAPERQLPYTAFAVAVTALAVVWPGGRVPSADLLFTISALIVILRAVTRHRAVADLITLAPKPAVTGAKIALVVMVGAQLWGVSTQTFPAATWTMYSHNPGDQASVYRFEGVTAEGETVAFVPRASNRTITAKQAVVVHLRGLSQRLYQSSLGDDPAQIAHDEAKLREAIDVFVELHNASSPDEVPVKIEVSRVVYDITQDEVSYDSGIRTVLLSVEVEAP